MSVIKPPPAPQYPDIFAINGINGRTQPTRTQPTPWPFSYGPNPDVCSKPHPTTSLGNISERETPQLRVEEMQKEMKAVQQVGDKIYKR